MAVIRKSTPAPAPPAGWTIALEVTLSGHRPQLEPGVELSVKVRGRNRRCRFMRHVRTDEGLEWLDVFDGRMVRSFPLDAVVTVHAKRRMPARD